MCVCVSFSEFPFKPCLILKQDKQLVLLLNTTSASPEGSGEACMMVVQIGDLPFISISGSSCLNQWEIDNLKVNQL